MEHLRGTGQLKLLSPQFLCEYSLLLGGKKSKKCANMRLQTENLRVTIVMVN